MSQSEDAEYRIRHFRALIDALPISLQMPLLDIGAGLGYFLQALPSDIANSVTLVEPSQFAHKWLVDQAPGRVFSSIDQLPIDQCFKSVTLWDVLAHIPHPLKTLKAVRKHMDAEGYLIIKTPYHPQRLFWLARLLAPIGRGHSLVHVPSMQFHFTPDSLTSLLQTAGFQKVESYWTTESKRPSSHWKQRMLTATKKLAIQKLSFVVICKPAQLS